MSDLSLVAIFGGGLIAISLEGVIRLSYWSLLYRATDADSLWDFLQTVATQPRHQRTAWWLRPLASAVGGAIAGLAAESAPGLHGAIAAAMLVVYTLLSSRSFSLSGAEVALGYLAQIALGAGGGLATAEILGLGRLPLAVVPWVAGISFLALLAAQRLLVPRDAEQMRGPKSKRGAPVEWTRKQWAWVLVRAVLIVAAGSLVFSVALLFISAGGRLLQWGYIVAGVAVVLQLVAVDRLLRRALKDWGYPAAYTSLGWMLALIMLVVGGHTIATFIMLTQMSSPTFGGGSDGFPSLAFNALVPMLPIVYLITSFAPGWNIFRLSAPYWVGASILMGFVPSMVRWRRPARKS